MNLKIIINDIANKVRSAVLTGLNVALTGAIVAGDTVLQAFGKIQNQINAINLSLGDKADQADLNSHTGDATIHFTEGSIDHANIQNIGTNTHAQIDSHIADDAKHREINDLGVGVTDLWSAQKIGNELGSKANDSDVVKLTGNQTIDGIKTFSSSPIVPAPTTDMQAATKKYVDDNAGASAAGDEGDIQFNDGADNLAADATLNFDSVNKLAKVPDLRIKESAGANAPAANDETVLKMETEIVGADTIIRFFAQANSGEKVIIYSYIV